MGAEIKGYSKQKYIYYEYPENRDVVFIFGAGASYADGVPLQSEIIPHLYNSNDCIMKESIAYRILIDFINTYFMPDIEHGVFPSLEQLFGYLEYHLNTRESLSSFYNTEQIMRVKSSLYYLIHYIINKNKNNSVDGAYSRFWNKIISINRNISIISFNYDTLLEENFDKFYLKGALIDYCVDFINFDPINSLGFDWWIDPRRPVKLPLVRNADEYNTVPIKIIKPHGSLNWKYCNCCNRVMLTHWQNDVDLNALEFSKSFLGDNTKLKCPYDSAIFTQMIIPPTHYKTFTNRILLNLFSEALKEIRCAKKICFIGYSFPESDMHIKAIIDKADLLNKEIFCINPYLNSASKLNYLSLKKDIEFIEMDFNEFLDSYYFRTIIGPYT